MTEQATQHNLISRIAAALAHLLKILFWLSISQVAVFMIVGQSMERKYNPLQPPISTLAENFFPAVFALGLFFVYRPFRLATLARHSRWLNMLALVSIVTFVFSVIAFFRLSDLSNFFINGVLQWMWDFRWLDKPRDWIYFLTIGAYLLVLSIYCISEVTAMLKDAKGSVKKEWPLAGTPIDMATRWNLFRWRNAIFAMILCGVLLGAIMTEDYMMARERATKPPPHATKPETP